MKSEILLGVTVVALAAALILSGRPFFPVNTPRIHEVATLPEGQKMEAVRRYTEFGSGLLPYNAREKEKRALKDWDEPTPLRLGYAYREISFLKLPFFAYEEYGLVTFLDTQTGYQIAIMQPKQLELLEELTGRKWSDYRFPIERHLWGWLFVFAIVGGLMWRMREQREAEGVV
jgi:hypothetical protein